MHIITTNLVPRASFHVINGKALGTRLWIKSRKLINKTRSLRLLLMVHVGLPVFWSHCRSQGLRFGRKRDTMRTVHTVQHNAMQCSSVQAQHNVHSTAQHNTIQYSSTVQYDIIQYKTIQYSIVLYNTIQCARLWAKLEKIKYNYNYKTKTEQTLTNHIKHNCNYIYLVRLFTKIIIFVFTKLERPFLYVHEFCQNIAVICGRQRTSNETNQR